MQMYATLRNCTLKMGQTGNVPLCVFDHNLSKSYLSLFLIANAQEWLFVHNDRTGIEVQIVNSVPPKSGSKSMQ